MEPVLKELSLLLRAVTGWFFSFLALAFFLFLLGSRQAEFLGISLPLPSFEGPTFSVEIFRALKEGLLPGMVQLVSLDPFAGFVTQVLVSVWVAFILTLPVLLWRLISYLSPALHKKERELLLLMIIPAFLLFFAGAAFAYYVIIPPTFRFLYAFAPELEARPFLLIDDFLSNVAMLMVSSGLMFLTPAFMVLLAWLRVIPSFFWRVWWRHAALGFLIFAAIITPDGSGVTMILLTLPMALLYVGGFLVARYMEKKSGPSRLVGDKEGGTLGE